MLFYQALPCSIHQCVQRTNIIVLCHERQLMQLSPLARAVRHVYSARYSILLSKRTAAESWLLAASAFSKSSRQVNQETDVSREVNASTCRRLVQRQITSSL